jgi:hypothetical protein
MRNCNYGLYHDERIYDEMSQSSMNSKDKESKYNLDKHIEGIDKEYDQSNSVSQENAG